MRPDHLLVSGSLNWLFWYQRRGRLFASASMVSPIEKAGQNGKRLSGSDLNMVLLDTGVAFWTATFSDWRKIISGAMATIPMVEETRPGEPPNGTAVSLFAAIGF